MAKHLQIATNKSEDILAIAEHKQIEDFEDGIQYYAARNANCNCIVTEDVEDYYFSDIEILCAEDFLEKYVY